jgi:ribosomal protein S18 acetylase RimI-like enzyme
MKTKVHLQIFKVYISGHVEYKFLAIVPHEIGGPMVVGHCCLHLDLERGWSSFKELFVMKEFRGGGIGTYLVRACCGFALARGAKDIGILIEHDNESVVAFYEPLGFRLCYADRDGLCFKKSLEAKEEGA